MLCSLWHSGDRYSPVKASLRPSLDPIPTSFLVVGVDVSGTTHFAYCEHGTIIKTGELESARCVEDFVINLYKVSIGTGVPLVIAIEKTDKFSFQLETVHNAIRVAISKTKSAEANKRVIIPRVLVIPKNDATKELFLVRTAKKEVLWEHGQKALGAHLNGSPEERVRAICVAHGLSRSHLGREVTPVSFKGKFYV